MTVCAARARQAGGLRHPSADACVPRHTPAATTPHARCAEANLGNCGKHEARTHTHTHPFNGPLSGTTWADRYQKRKTNLDFAEARDSEWQLHQQGHMQVCYRQIAMPAPHRSVFYRPDPLPVAQPSAQSTEGSETITAQSVYTRETSATAQTHSTLNLPVKN